MLKEYKLRYKPHRQNILDFEYLSNLDLIPYNKRKKRIRRNVDSHNLFGNDKTIDIDKIKKRLRDFEITEEV